MVDVGGKAVVRRTATAVGFVRMARETVGLLREQALPKGDALNTARIAGVMAAKRTQDLIPLCHGLNLTGVDVEFEVGEEGVGITATARVSDRTGVEMEALTAVSVAALTIYDMCKAVDKGMVIEDVRLVEKTKENLSSSP
jgi:cyclic pyranopterin phosphate synthase